MTLKELLFSLKISESKLRSLQNFKKHISQEKKEEIINAILKEIKCTGKINTHNKNFTETLRITLMHFIDTILTGDLKSIELEINNIVEIHSRKKTKEFTQEYIRFINILINKLEIPEKEKENFNTFLTILLSPLFLLLTKNIISNQEIDTITSLKSKNIFFANYYKIITKAKTIVLVDINEFKNINIYYGFKTGNNILSIFSTLIKSIFPNAFITRIQNDEFLILTNRSCDNTYIKLRELQNHLVKHPPRIPSDKTAEDIILTFSAVIIDETFCPTSDPDYLLWILYEGIKKAKKSRNNIRILYPKEVSDFILNRKLMLDVINAIKNKNMKLGLHGIFSLNNHSILFKEALARIHIKDITIEAEKFIKIIHKTNIEEKLDRLMVDKVFEYIKEKQPPFKISINLSSNFMQDSFSWFIDRLKYYNVKEENIAVELTERDDIMEIPEIEEKLSILNRRGVETFIDDFGVKYANYELLRKLPVSGIKLEGSIVKNLENNSLDKHFVRYSIKLAKEKNLKLVAEYVETENIKRTLKNIAEEENFDKLYAQGFLFEKVQVVQ